jgi:hypothetical protein
LAQVGSTRTQDSLDAQGGLVGLHCSASKLTQAMPSAQS